MGISLGRFSGSSFGAVGCLLGFVFWLDGREVSAIKIKIKSGNISQYLYLSHREEEVGGKEKGLTKSGRDKHPDPSSQNYKR